MGSQGAIAEDTPLSRLTDFLGRYPDVKYLRLVNFNFAGVQSIKVVPIHHAKLIAARSNVLRPGTEMAPSEGQAADGEDERGVVRTNPTYTEAIIMAVGDTGVLDFGAIREGEMSIQIDWTTLSPILVQPSHAFVSISTYHYNANRKPGHGYDRDPRIALSRILRQAKEKHGLDFTVGVEIEFALYDEKDLSTPIKEPRGGLCGNQHGSRVQSIAEEAVDALEYAGVHVWSLHPEDGQPGHMEIQLFPSDPLSQVDWVLFAHHIIRNVATKHGCYAAFNAKGAEGTVGRHIHLSLNRPEEGKHFLGGLIKHMPAMFVMLHASIDGYSCRHLEAGPYVLWADSKCGPIHWKEDGRFELRMPDCHMNVCVQMAALIIAGLDGIENKLVAKQESLPFDELFKYALAGPDTAVKADLAKKFGLDIALPADLGEAIEKFKEEKDFWVEALGEKMVEGILFTQEGKWKRKDGQTVEQRRIALIEHFG